MLTPDFYRYFLGCLPQPLLYPELRKIARDAGQPPRLQALHFTFCVIAETAERDRFIQRRAEACLGSRRLPSFPINLSRVVGGAGGAEARTRGSQDELQDAYRRSVRLLRHAGLKPFHRKSGLRPHMTLGYAPCRFEPRRIGIEWLPNELVLIESEVGLSRHNLLAAWPLKAPRQGQFAFAAPADGALMRGEEPEKDAQPRLQAVRLGDRESLADPLHPERPRARDLPDRSRAQRRAGKGPRLAGRWRDECGALAAAGLEMLPADERRRRRLGDGTWLTGPSHRSEQSCVQDVDYDANRASSYRPAHSLGRLRGSPRPTA